MKIALKYILLIFSIAIISCTSTKGPDSSNSHHSVHHNLKAAKHKYEIQDYHGAIIDYTKVLDVDKNKFEALVGRAQSKMELSDYYGALKDLHAAEKVDATDARVFMGLGNSHYFLQNYRQAISNFDKVIALEPDHIDAYFKRGKSENAIDAYVQSIDDFTKIIELNPNSQDAYYLRGTIRIAHGDREGGCKDLSRAGELGDEDAYDKIKELCTSIH